MTSQGKATALSCLLNAMICSPVAVRLIRRKARVRVKASKAPVRDLVATGTEDTNEARLMTAILGLDRKLPSRLPLPTQKAYSD